VKQRRKRCKSRPYVVRIDHNFNPSNSVWFAIPEIPYTSTIPGGFESFGNGPHYTAENYGINYLHMFSSSNFAERTVRTQWHKHSSHQRVSLVWIAATVLKLQFCPDLWLWVCVTQVPDSQCQHAGIYFWGARLEITSNDQC